MYEDLNTEIISLSRRFGALETSLEGHILACDGRLHQQAGHAAQQPAARGPCTAQECRAEWVWCEVQKLRAELAPHLAHIQGGER